MSLINLWILYVTFVDIIMLRQAQFPIILVKACQEQENISKHLLQSKWFYLKGGNKNRTYSVVVDKTVKL